MASLAETQRQQPEPRRLDFGAQPETLLSSQNLPRKSESCQRGWGETQPSKSEPLVRTEESAVITTTKNDYAPTLSLSLYSGPKPQL